MPYYNATSGFYVTPLNTQYVIWGVEGASSVVVIPEIIQDTMKPEDPLARASKVNEFVHPFEEI